MHKKFTESYVQIVARLGSVEEPLRAVLLDMMMSIAEDHEDDIRQLEKAHEQEQELAAQERALELLLAQREHDREVLGRANAQSEAEAIRVLWKAPDGRAMIEQLFKRDPRMTKLRLEYLGAYEVAGELSIRFAEELRDAQKGPKKDAVS